MVDQKPTLLQIAISVLLGERHLIEHLYEYGITCSYTEFLRFRTSAASNQNDNILDSLPKNGGQVQAIADNYDRTISSPNGLKQTHELAMIITQQGECENAMHLTFPRLSNA